MSTLVTTEGACLKGVRTLAPTQASLSLTHTPPKAGWEDSFGREWQSDWGNVWLTDDSQGRLFSRMIKDLWPHTFQPSLELRQEGKKRHVYEHIAALQAAQHTSNQRRAGGVGGNKMFMTEVDDWILISHSTFTRCTSVAQRRPKTSGNGTLLLKMTCCQNSEQTHLLLLSAPLSIFIQYTLSHTVIHDGEDRWFSIKAMLLGPPWICQHTISQSKCHSSWPKP